MRLESVALRGLTTFREPAAVDVGGLGEGLIAVVGRNGAGKSSLLESVPAALYKRLPSRPGFYEHFAGKDAFVEAVFKDGQDTITVRLQVDAERRTVERHVLLNGRPQTSGKRVEADAEVARRFGTEALFLSSVFACQTKAGNFLLLPKAERKDLFRELLAIGGLEALSLSARERKTRADRDVVGRRGVLSTIDEELETVPELREAERRERELAASRESRRVAAQQAVEAAHTALAEAKANEQAYAAVARLQAETAREVREREVAIREIEQEPAAIRRKAAASKNALPDVEGLLRRAQARFDSESKRLDDRRIELREMLSGFEGIRAQAAALPALESEETQLVGRQAELEAAQRNLEQARQAHRDRVRLNRLAREAREQTVERLSRQAEMLEDVPCGATLQKKCPLLTAAVEAKRELKRGVQSPDFDQAAEDACVEAVAAAERAVETAQAGVDARRLADVRRAIGAARTAHGRVQACEQAQSELDTLDAQGGDLHEAYEADERAARDEETRSQAVVVEINAEMAEALTVVEQRLEAARQAHAAAKERLAQVSKDLADHANVSSEAAGSALKTAQVKLKEADEEWRSSSLALERTLAQLEALGKKEERRATLQAGLDEMLVTLGDWTLLEQALGRDGIQALEIDAAGPEVALICNELLEACYGARFSLSFETLREKKSKPGEYSEAFDVRVFDGGHERQVEALSGGEKVVVGEALGLAIAIYNARKSGTRWETIVRDETAGALDPENAVAYVDMLRRARALGGFRQVLFVSHQPEVWERADVRLQVEAGRVSVRQ